MGATPTCTCGRGQVLFDRHDPQCALLTTPTGITFDPPSMTPTMTNDELEANATFIAHARTDIPALLDALTRAEAHAALLQTEATYWHDKHNQDRLALAASEAHAERLAGALADVQNPACLMMCPDVWPDDTDQPHTIACTNARQALSAYRGVKDEACSRPSDALDAPVCASEVPPDA